VEGPAFDRRLNEITTQWTMVFQAHGGAGEARRGAQEALLQRYCGAIYRYLLAALRDADAADEVCQEFALRFVRGYFHRADPQRGRFRNYVKTALVRLVGEYRRRNRRRPQPLPDGSLGPAVEQDQDFSSDEAFVQHWRAALLARAWEALAAFEKTTHCHFHAVLRFRSAHPDLPSQEIAAQLSGELGKPLTAAGVRQTLRRAREKFADLLLDEVAGTLQTDDPAQLEQELLDLNLMAYCQTALQRRLAKPGE
jgi:RNA polymerase sigma factor (sigma-70 family)